MGNANENKNAETIRIPSAELQAAFHHILLKHGFNEDKALLCAEVFTANSVDGVYTHGVNRFPRFVRYVQDGFIKAGAEPVKVSASGCMEQWDGNLGPGPLSALKATERAMELSRQHGMGCVALKNTNHWMRGGLYGWKAAGAGYAFIGWTNTIANMPAWGAMDSRLGNNPLVMAVPFENDAIVLDMAMSQYSFGSIEMHRLKNRQLDFPGGFDKEGKITSDPSAIMETQRGLPIGYWKGAGLSLLLDILAAVLSGGDSTRTVTQKGTEYGMSQVFIAIYLPVMQHYATVSNTIRQIISDYHASVLQDAHGKILYPGERVKVTRKENLEKGVPVAMQVWNKIRELHG
jgi:3-dehydro-L-gulonate 2-dehydrogenase